MKKEDKIQDLVQDFEPSSNKDAMNIKTCMEKKRKKRREQPRAGSTNQSQRGVELSSCSPGCSGNSLESPG